MRLKNALIKLLVITFGLLFVYGTSWGMMKLVSSDKATMVCLGIMAGMWMCLITSIVLARIDGVGDAQHQEPRVQRVSPIPEKVRVVLWIIAVLAIVVGLSFAAGPSGWVSLISGVGTVLGMGAGLREKAEPKKSP